MSDMLSIEDDLTQRIRPQAPKWLDLAAWLDACPQYWGGFLLRPQTRTWACDDLLSVPMRSGVYALLVGGAISYIGRSGCLQDRLTAHHYHAKAERAPWFDRFTFRLVPEHALAGMEIAHIHALEPERNALYEPPTWRGHDSAVEALRAAWGEKR